MPSISLVRVSGGKVTALNLANNIGQDREVNARAHGFRRMIEKVGNRVSSACVFSFLLLLTRDEVARHGLPYQRES